jgi:hypothetical protein
MERTKVLLGNMAIIFRKLILLKNLKPYAAHEQPQKSNLVPLISTASSRRDISNIMLLKDVSLPKK